MILPYPDVYTNNGDYHFIGCIDHRFMIYILVPETRSQSVIVFQDTVESVDNF